jgi:hypothetical protein
MQRAPLQSQAMTRGKEARSALHVLAAQRLTPAEMRSGPGESTSRAEGGQARHAEKKKNGHGLTKLSSHVVAGCECVTAGWRLYMRDKLPCTPETRLAPRALVLEGRRAVGS